MESGRPRLLNSWKCSNCVNSKVPRAITKETRKKPLCKKRQGLRVLNAVVQQACSTNMQQQLHCCQSRSIGGGNARRTGKSKSSRLRILVVIPPYPRCDSCHKAYTRARYWGKRKEHTCKDCGDSRMAGQNRCESSWNDYGDRRREEVRERHRRRDAEPLHPPPVQGKQCANPNCAILLPSIGQLWKQYCLTCYQHKKVHKGQEIPRGMYEKSKKQLDEEHQKFAPSQMHRCCLWGSPACWTESSAGRYRKCDYYFEIKRNKKDKISDVV